MGTTSAELAATHCVSEDRRDSPAGPATRISHCGRRRLRGQCGGGSAGIDHIHFRRTRSAASAGRRPLRPSAQRYSMATFRSAICHYHSGSPTTPPYRWLPVQSGLLGEHQSSGPVPRCARAVSGQATELASPAMNSRRHSITSSARTSGAGGNVRPSVFAVLRLIINSILVAR
jgi:hypothetical protein